VNTKTQKHLTAEDTDVKVTHFFRDRSWSRSRTQPSCIWVGKWTIWWWL